MRKNQCEIHLKEVVAQVKNFIKLITETILNFYSIKLAFADLRKELIIIIATNLILSDEVYFILFNLYSFFLEEDLQKLRIIMKNEAMLAKYFNFEDLRIG